MLHGSGDDEYGLLEVGRCLAPSCGGALVVSLRGPRRRGGGYCWFEGSSHQPAPDAEASILDASEKVLHLLQLAPEAFGTDPARAFLFGHSQGAAVGWAVALSRWPRAELLRGIVCNSGRLFPGLAQPSSPLGQRLAPAAERAERRVFFAHGQRDMITPVSHGRQNVKYCQELGLTQHTYHEHEEGHNDLRIPIVHATRHLAAALDSMPGTAVRIIGLVKAAQHNDKVGRRLDRKGEDGRVAVQLADGQVLSVRPENLEAV